VDTASEPLTAETTRSHPIVDRVMALLLARAAAVRRKNSTPG
jgi:hypothetical protein